MINIQSMMLILLGFLLASLFVVLIAPAYRRRVERLTTNRIRQSVPITEAEIRADKDRLRAQFAIRIHKLEAQGEQERLLAARQLIEMNRRDARITELNGELESLRANLEENVNARRVLEHTVTDRLPRLEQQLGSARLLINSRDVEMTELKAETTRSVRALDEALQINAQQRSDMERMTGALTPRAVPGSAPTADVRYDGEIALRSEIEALRTRTREQAELIARLQPVAPGAAGADAGAAAEAERLRRELSDAEGLLASVKAQVQTGSAERSAAEIRLSELTATVDDQAAEIARLTAALAAYEEDADPVSRRPNAIRDTRATAKAKVGSLQAQIATQNETIQKLRADLAAANERLARQSQQYMEEMRRIGTGAVPTSLEPRRGREAASRRSLSDRISQTASTVPADAAPADARKPAAGERGPTSNKVAEYLRALTDEAPVATGEPAADAATPVAVPELVSADAGPAVAVAAASGDATATGSKVRLLDRISGIAKG